MYWQGLQVVASCLRHLGVDRGQDWPTDRSNDDKSLCKVVIWENFGVGMPWDKSDPKWARARGKLKPSCDLRLKGHSQLEGRQHAQ